jgi:hypothetical protein
MNVDNKSSRKVAKIYLFNIQIRLFQFKEEKKINGQWLVFTD